MKKALKVLSVLLALCFLANTAFAAVSYTVTSRDRYTDDQGNDVVRSRGYITMDSSYPCDTATGRCGYAVKADQLGMNSIAQMAITPMVSTNVGGNLVLFKYHNAGVADNGSTGAIRGYYTALATGVTAGGLASMPSYNLSDLTTVPFEAIGA